MARYEILALDGDDKQTEIKEGGGRGEGEHPQRRAAQAGKCGGCNQLGWVWAEGGIVWTLRDVCLDNQALVPEWCPKRKKLIVKGGSVTWLLLLLIHINYCLLNIVFDIYDPQNTLHEIWFLHCVIYEKRHTSKYNTYILVDNYSFDHIKLNSYTKATIEELFKVISKTWLQLTGERTFTQDVWKLPKQCWALVIVVENNLVGSLLIWNHLHLYQQRVQSRPEIHTFFDTKALYFLGMYGELYSYIYFKENGVTV